MQEKQQPYQLLVLKYAGSTFNVELTQLDLEQTLEHFLETEMAVNSTTLKAIQNQAFLPISTSLSQIDLKWPVHIFDVKEVTVDQLSIMPMETIGDLIISQNQTPVSQRQLRSLLYEAPVVPTNYEIIDVFKYITEDDLINVTMPLRTDEIQEKFAQDIGKFVPASENFQRYLQKSFDDYKKNQLQIKIFDDLLEDCKPGQDVVLMKLKEKWESEYRKALALRNKLKF